MAPRMQQDIEMGYRGSEAGNEAQDVESLQPPRRGLGWKIHGQRVGPGLSAASISSAISHWSVQWVARWVPRSNRAIAEEVSPESLSDAQNSFLAEILGLELGEKPREELKDACAWYMNFLEFKIRQAWKSLFIPVLRGTIGNEQAPPPNSEDFSLTFEILKTIAEALRRENLALTDILDKLYNENLFKEADGDRSHANQLVFAALGWISSLYSARHDPDPMKLQINLPDSTSSVPESPHTARRRRRSKKETFTHFSHTQENNDQPLNTLLGSFGKVIPQRQRQWVSGRVSPASINPVRHDDDWIELSLLCFHALNKVANVKIEWVDSLSLHLEFDNKTKVLKVFRLPSLCLLMCCCEKVSPLSQIFYDATGESEGYSDDLEDASDFYSEVLLSYRLIFGQDLSSAADFLLLARDTPLPLDFYDPLLPALCGAKWPTNDKAREVYELIVAEDPSSQYRASIHFPFLGKRLLDIQTHVKGFHPNDFRSLWNDRRNRERWWTFWAVIFFGGLSLILALIFGFLQTILAGYQVYYARKQYLQQPMAPI
ncbi:uncharacterized protein K444DRAFT_442681 [Hyaloscypha bicolor E]|uniref:Uncharacterized protein n=1 Tax=Hyaloscypha bicolor E TaxID=1095630 RepID=A0A2J6T5K5_9HELO|nr:uncharacterized protein K444DRAFT_442681 [Hyaloscypha bicolor E]PMD58304.1 hypothetical protein K444DRAFT_442681 [Hyaloscypha bicolor E]